MVVTKGGEIMKQEFQQRGVATGSTDDPEGQWGTDGGQNIGKATMVRRRGIVPRKQI